MGHSWIEIGTFFLALFEHQSIKYILSHYDNTLTDNNCSNNFYAKNNNKGQVFFNMNLHINFEPQKLCSIRVIIFRNLSLRQTEHITMYNPI